MRGIVRFKDFKILRLIFLFSILQSPISQSSSASITLGNLARDQFFSFYLAPSDLHYGWLNSAYLWPTVGGISGSGLADQIAFWHTSDSLAGSPYLRFTTSHTLCLGYLPTATAGLSLLIGNSTNGSLFTINDSGNLTLIRKVPYSFPSAQGDANTYFRNDGAGNLTWSLVTAAPDTHDILNQSIHNGFINDTTRFLRRDASWNVPNLLTLIGFPPAPTLNTFLRDDRTWAIPAVASHNNNYHTIPYADSARFKAHLDSAAYWLDSCKVKVDTTRLKSDSIVNKVFHDSTRSHTNTFHTIPYADSAKYKVFHDSTDNFNINLRASLIVQDSWGNSAVEHCIKNLPIPANTFVIGSSYRIIAKGELSDSAVAPTLTIRVRCGDTLTGNIAISIVIPPTTSLNKRYWDFDGLVTVRTVTMGGLIWGEGEFVGNIGAANAFLYSGSQTSAGVAVNVAIENYLSLTAQFSQKSSKNILFTQLCDIYPVKY